MADNTSTLPNPTDEQLDSAEFKAVWETIKGWDIESKPDEGCSGATGSNVAAILNALQPVTERRMTEVIGWISSELATRAGAQDGNAPDWFPEPPEWLELLEKALAETGDSE